jgi:hypothetical protein
MENPVPSPVSVYSQLARGLGSAVSAEGGTPVPSLSYPSWFREDAKSERVYLSFQVDKKATDYYSGGGFRIELERSSSDRPSGGLKGRALFFQLLTPGEIRTLLDKQNQVIRSLSKPPAEHVEQYPAGPVRDQYLSYFEDQGRFDAIQSWLRFRHSLHIDEWVEALDPLVGKLFERATRCLERQTLHLGRGSLL